MAVREMSENECMNCLAKGHVGHLACAKGGLPYIVPIHYAFGFEKLYVFSLPGQKIDWLRSNPNACIQVEEMSDSQLWRSVIVRGNYDELPDTTDRHDERIRAWQLLQERRVWWEPGAMKPDGDTPTALLPIFFGIVIDEVTGRQTF